MRHAPSPADDAIPLAEIEAAASALREAFVRRYCAGTRPFNPLHQDLHRLTVNVSLSPDGAHAGGSLVGVYAGAVHAITRAEGEATMAARMKDITGGLPLPPGMSLPF